jgi:hypothetical protein
MALIFNLKAAKSTVVTIRFCTVFLLGIVMCCRLHGIYLAIKNGGFPSRKQSLWADIT